MNILYEKIYENFCIDVDIDSIINGTGPDLVNPDKQWIPFSDKSGVPHWQMFNAGVAFSRNFHRNFRPFCIKVAEKLSQIQHELRNREYKSDFLKIFLNHKIDERLVNLIKVPAGNNVKPHVDSTRDICINIGLRNSHVCKTHIADTFDVSDFWENNTRKTYCMADGDVYMVSVKNVHAVESINTENNLIRYIITYNMLLR